MEFWQSKTISSCIALNISCCNTAFFDVIEPELINRDWFLNIENLEADYSKDCQEGCSWQADVLHSFAACKFRNVRQVVNMRLKMIPPSEMEIKCQPSTDLKPKQHLISCIGTQKHPVWHHHKDEKGAKNCTCQEDWHVVGKWKCIAGGVTSTGEVWCEEGVAKCKDHDECCIDGVARRTCERITHSVTLDITPHPSRPSWVEGQLDNWCC